MLASSPTNPAFWFLYAWCGISDAADGPIARKLGEEGAFGARLDSAADLAFAIACCLSLLPECRLATWLMVTITVLATAKALLFALGRKNGYDLHSGANKKPSSPRSSLCPYSFSPT